MERPLRLVPLTFAALLVSATSARAQAPEFSRADRLAILYTPQLTFASTGEPLIKIGLVEGVDRIEFSADTAVTVLPLGETGPHIEVPAGLDLRVTIEDGEPGAYRHRVVVGELSPAQRGGIDAEIDAWRGRGFDAATVEVGSLFAIAGQRFDTRRTLITVPGGPTLADSEDVADALDEQFGIDARVHSDLDEYPGGTLVLSGLPGGVTVTHRDLLQVRGGSDTVFTVEDVPHDIGTRYEGYETRRYAGSLLFTADRDGHLALVNEATLERLLYGIVPAEIYTSAPSDALRAQAVAARSEILRDLGARHLADPYMTCSDQRCQVYGGLDYEDAATTRAVDDTRGAVVTEGDRIIRAYYSANNGGFAGSNATTWGDPQMAYLSPHLDAPTPEGEFADGLQTEDEIRRFIDDPPDVYSNITSFGASRSFRWTETLTGSELDAAVNARADVGLVADFEVVERDISGRATRLRIVGSRGDQVIERELNIRRLFGGLRSALFYFAIDRDSSGAISSVTFTGGGFGHGVGLCQNGAIGAAERGLDWQEILANYYPGTSVRQIY